MDIEILTPILIGFTVEEVDDHIPAVKFLFKISARQFSHELLHTGEMWIRTENFDNFVHNLNDYDSLCFLESLDQNCSIKIITVEGKRKLQLTIKRVSAVSGILASYIETTLDDADFDLIRAKFSDFMTLW